MDGEVWQEVEETVANESEKECKEANEYLEALPPRAVERGKSRMIAGRLLQLQLKHIEDLEEEGILTANGAHEIQEKLHLAQRELNRTDFPHLTQPRLTQSLKALPASNPIYR